MGGTLGPACPLVLWSLPEDRKYTWDSGPVGIGGMHNGDICVPSSLWCPSAANMASLRPWERRVAHMYMLIIVFLHVVHVHIYTFMWR